MTPKETEAVKQALSYIKIARRSGYLVFNAMLASDRFEEEVLRLLEQVCGWDEKDEEGIAKLAELLQEETKGKTLREKGERLSRLLKIGGITVTGVGITGGIIAYLMKKGKNAEK